MEPIVVSWLSLASFSPVVVLLLVASIFTSHTYKDQWISLDLLLVGSAAVELVTVLIIFSYSVVKFLDLDLSLHFCTLYTWSLMSTRFLQLAILASMAFYRGLYLNSSSRPYRVKITRNQTRYHLVMLSLVAMSLSVAAVFARLPTQPPAPPPTPFSSSSSSSTPSTSSVPLPSTSPSPQATSGHETCSVMRASWSTTFTIFLFVVLMSFILIHLVCSICGCIIQSYRRHWNHPRSISYSGDEFPRRYSVVSIIVITCYAVHHLPYLLISVFVSFVFPVSSPWLENGFCWFAVAEAFFLPFVYALADKPHSNALISIVCSRRAAKHSFDENSDNSFQYSDELPEAKVAPRALFSNNFTSNGFYCRPGLKTNCGNQSAIWPNAFLRKNILSGNDESSISTPPTLSTFDGCLSNIIDINNLYPSPQHDACSLDSEDRCSCIGSSVAANDDFEFHDGRLISTPQTSAIRLCPQAEMNSEKQKNKSSNNTEPTALITLAMSLSMNDLDKIHPEASPLEQTCEIYLTNTMTKAVSDTQINQVNPSPITRLENNKHINDKNKKLPPTQIEPFNDVLLITPNISHNFKKVIITKYL